MQKQNSLKSKGRIKLISILLILIILTISVILIPSYPLRMCIVYILLTLFFIFCLTMLIIKEKKQKILLIIFSIIAIGMIGIFLFRTYKMVEDLKKGPNEAIMTNMCIKTKKTSGKYQTKYYYIEGYVEGKKIQIKIVNNWKEIIERVKKDKTAKIYYYTNSKTLYDVDFSYNEEKNKVIE